MLDMAAQTEFPSIPDSDLTARSTNRRTCSRPTHSTDHKDNRLPRGNLDRGAFHVIPRLSANYVSRDKVVARSSSQLSYASLVQGYLPRRADGTTTIQRKILPELLLLCAWRYFMNSRVQCSSCCSQAWRSQRTQNRFQSGTLMQMDSVQCGVDEKWWQRALLAN